MHPTPVLSVSKDAKNSVNFSLKASEDDEGDVSFKVETLTVLSLRRFFVVWKC